MRLVGRVLVTAFMLSLLMASLAAETQQAPQLRRIGLLGNTAAYAAPHLDPRL